MTVFTKELTAAIPATLPCASLAGVTTMSSTEATDPNAPVSMTEKWGKTFAESSKMGRCKVTFQNRCRITLVDDLYLPKDRSERKLAAIATSGPFGTMKGQSNGLYVQTPVGQGFVTLSFDLSYTDKSSDYPRNMTSPDINTEDFSATVDFLGLQKEVDHDRIGLLDIYGWGDMTLNDTVVDTRVKAAATSVIYDMSHAMGHGVGNGKDRYMTADRRAVLQYLDAQRWKDAADGTSAPGGHNIYVDDKDNVSAADRVLSEVLPTSPNPALKGFFGYYRMLRDFHARLANPTGAWDATMPLPFMNMPLLSYTSEVAIPTLIVIGEQAHSRYFAEDAFEIIGSKEKALVIVPGANHVDLYDNIAGKILFATFTQSFKTDL